MNYLGMCAAHVRDVPASRCDKRIGEGIFSFDVSKDRGRCVVCQNWRSLSTVDDTIVHFF